MNDEFYRELVIDSISVILRKVEEPHFKCIFKSGRSSSGFVYFTKGFGTYTDQNGKVFSFKENDFLIVEKGSLYSVETGDCPSEYITTAFLLNEKSSFKKFGLPTFFSAGDSTYFRKKVNILVKIWEENSPFSLMWAKIILGEIFLAICTQYEKNAIDHSKSSPIELAIEYINKNFNKKISTQQLAKMCLMSESYFRKQFILHTSFTPLKYREIIRIKWAKRYLKTNLFSISEIAERLGYCDIYHFSKIFKSYCNITPSEYKKKNLIL